MALPDLAYRLIGWFSTTRFDRVLHPILYRRSSGSGLAGRVLGSDMILVTTTGRKTGEPRTVALFAFPSDGGWIVVGSRGGSGRVPDWAHNLQADARATIRLRAREAPALAHELTGDEYEAAFALAATAYPGYRLYRRNASHHIPIFRLEPAPAPGATA
jgi:F420H(2)-dependent quinone reductase